MKHLGTLFLIACGSSTPVPAPAPAPEAQMKHDPKAHGDHHAKHAHGDHHAQHGHGDHAKHAQHVHEGHGHHRFEKAEDWVPMFDDPKRDEWQKPDVVLTALQLTEQPDINVADIGAGTGYFTSRIAPRIKGDVIAVDVEADMVRYLGERAKRDNTPNVKPQLGAPDDPKLPAASVHRILVVNTWHHLGDRGAYAKKLAAALRPGGFLLVVDFKLDSHRGPPKEMKLAPDVIRGELKAAGLDVALLELGLPDQYVLKAQKPGPSAGVRSKAPAGI